MRSWLVLVSAAALAAGCSDGKAPIAPDGAPMPDAPIDTVPSFAACAEFTTTSVGVPAHVVGTLAGADLASPTSCVSIDAPFGIETAGPDAVVRVDDLVVGSTYVVNLTSTSDLSFYVATGCGTMTGPSADQCLAFVDATQRGELGKFVATAATAFIVVDYYQASPPSDMTFALDVYEAGCETSATCSATPQSPVCRDFRCVECASSFDCRTAEKSRCDTASNTCVAGADACLTDDASEPNDDGPAGARVLVVDGSGAGSIAGSTCATPSDEADFIAFDVATVGEAWSFQLAWSGFRDLDLEIFDGAGDSLGTSYWESPERIAVTYLPPGRYYAAVTEYATSALTQPLAYTLSATRTLGPGCTSTADCAAEHRNQTYRGTCSAGSCVAIDGNGALAEGAACDSQSDCADALHCPSFFYVSDADTRETCNRECASDVQCDAGFVCTTYLQTNFCVPACTETAQCPAIRASEPQSGPWTRLACDVPTGRCHP